MKKLLFIALLALLGQTVHAQSFRFTLTIIRPPCDSDGIVVATFDSSSLRIPGGILNLIWGLYAPGTWPNQYYAARILSYSGGAFTDTLYGYPGGPMIVMADTSGYWGGTGPLDTINSSLPFKIVDSGTSAACPTAGMLGATISGGGGPFAYQWLSQDTTSVCCVTYITMYSVIATSNPARVPNGTYFIRVTDSSTGCISGFSNPPVRVNIIPDFTDSVITTPELCLAIGSAITVFTGGTLPITTSWTNVTTGVVVGTGDTISLHGGTYTEQISDAIGCVATNTVVITYVPGYTGVVTTTGAACTNGTASVTVSGGTAPYSYLWSTGATTPSISGLVGGGYPVILTDGHGCMDSFAIDPGLFGYVAQTVTISAAIVSTPAACLLTDGALIAFGTGGTPPYSYLWNNGGTTQAISGLTPGYYNVTTTDANGCIGSVSTHLNTSSPLYLRYSITPSACTIPTGTATLTMYGGTPPYSVNWYTTPAASGITATGLSAGNYYFTVTDSVGCLQSGYITVPSVDVITLALNSSPATCLAADGSVSVTATGGVAPYTYLWSAGGSAAVLASVTAGIYTVTVTDSNGCSVSKYQHVPFSSPLELGLSSTDASCLYNADGTITAVAAMGTPPYTYSMGGSASGAVTATGITTGPYWISVSDALGCSTAGYTYVGYNREDSSCFCITRGIVYDDINQNCVQDSGEAGIQNIQLQASGFGYTYTDSSGNYAFLLPSGTYNISQTILHMYPLAPCQPDNIAYTAVAATGCATAINFADTLNPIRDMHISTWNYSVARPGFPYIQTTIITNDGTHTEPNILVSYAPDGQVYGPTFVPCGVLTGAPYYYSTTDSVLSLAPGVGQQFLMTYYLPADIPLGTNVIFKDSVAYAPPISNWLNDYSPWNNVNYFTTTTVGPYDPNFKQVSPQGTGPYGIINTSDSILEYMVHFQNTGTYPAENVVVIDTLDPALDWSTLRPVYMSHKGTVSMNEQGVATFTFSHINLPDSVTQPVTSNAMFTYTVKQRPLLAHGTQIRNHASIYFDYNPPVVTNSTLNTIFAVSAVPAIQETAGSNSFTLFPNPAQNTFTAMLNLNTGGNYSIKVCDITGKTIMEERLNLQKGSQNIAVDARTLTPGIYLVTFTDSNNNAQTQKLVIMK